MQKPPFFTSLCRKLWDYAHGKPGRIAALCRKRYNHSPQHLDTSQTLLWRYGCWWSVKSFRSRTRTMSKCERESALAKASLRLFWLNHTKSSQTHGVISKGGKKNSRQSEGRTKHSGWRSPWQHFSSAGQCCCHNALFSSHLRSK